MKKYQEYRRFYESLEKLGIDEETADKLRRIEMTLSRWSEQVCGNSDNYKSWSIERDEETQIPYMCIYPHQGKSYKYKIPDRETGALKRLESIMSNYPDLWFYYQTDPRGCSLYIGRKSELRGELKQYYTTGVPVCLS
jgi:hypothetical protein